MGKTKTSKEPAYSLGHKGEAMHGSKSAGMMTSGMMGGANPATPAPKRKQAEIMAVEDPGDVT